MNKTEFNKLVRKVLVKNMTHSSNEKEADHVINTFVESITLALKDNDEVFLVGFGRFFKQKVATRKGRNPKTGETMTIPAYIQPRFTAGKNLKDSCNNIT
ncbi:HU family DNA-binding protein (plasmid) [Candidatus Trichorickettsia mobilis]|uniref:HU family DNA-binding protein n=1 Tax=Candidatus Trichorickettsia mobilis TaxID=1346319 RepID=UPI002B2598C7|nr:HU family DNA-binding protein [Candidatus Trichorickettsia mobilis]WPY01765.1 HU family DNA-binding protein [Candidatus Trichorickettsia mobilis]